METRRPLRLIQYPIYTSALPLSLRPRSVGAAFSATCRPPPCRKPRDTSRSGRGSRQGIDTSLRDNFSRLETVPNVPFRNEKLKEIMLFEETVRLADGTKWKENQENPPPIRTRKVKRPKNTKKTQENMCSFLTIMKVNRQKPVQEAGNLCETTQTESPGREVWSRIEESQEEYREL